MEKFVTRLNAYKLDGFIKNVLSVANKYIVLVK